jgi:hypothetical protein
MWKLLSLKRLGKLPRHKSSRNGLAGKVEVESLRSLKVRIGKLLSTIDADVMGDRLHGCPDTDGKFGIDFLSSYGILISKDRSSVSFLK